MQPKELEREAWLALAMRHGGQFFRDHMADDAVMVFPDARLAKDDVIRVVGLEEPWEEFHFSDERLLELREEVHLLTYRVRAKRAARPWYEAVITSAYVIDDGGRWRLMFHQQTPQQPASGQSDAAAFQWSRMPLLDEHVEVIRASPDDVWVALLQTVERSFTGDAAQTYARLVGCSDRARSEGRPLVPGSTLAGFRVERAVPARELVLTGRHRYASYRLTFRLDPVASNSTRLSAETRAEFRGWSSRVYRRLLRDSRLHALLVRRFLRTVTREAERGVG